MGVMKKTLLGKELIFTEEMDLFNSIRKKYLLLSQEARKKAEEEYKKITNYSEYRSYGQGIMDELFEHYLQIGVHDIIKYDIYDIDEVVLREEFEKSFGCTYQEEINYIVGQLNQIDAEQAAADAERREAIQETSLVDGMLVSSTGNVVGDLFSMAGAKLSSVAINAVAKGGTALVTGGIRALEKQGAENDRISIFENPSTKENLLNGVELDVYLLHRVIARLINERTGKSYFYYATEEMIDRFEPICRNILQGNFKDAGQLDLECQQIHNMVKMNPYELRIYCYIMKESGGITAELKELLEYLYVDKSSMTDSYLESRYDLNTYSIYESMLDLEKIILREMEEFGVTDCSFYRKVVSKKEALYKERRTFHGYVYDSIGDKELAEEQYNDFVQDEFEKMSLDELLQKYEMTYDGTRFESIQEELRVFIMGFINVKINEFKMSESVKPYVAYALEKKEEYRLENSELLNVFESKYKALVMKEKIAAGIEAVKLRLIAIAEAIKWRAKVLVKKIKEMKDKLLALKPKAEKKSLPGKKDTTTKKNSSVKVSFGKKKEKEEQPVLEKTNEVEWKEPETESIVQPQPEPKTESAVQAQPESKIEPEAQAQPEPQLEPQVLPAIKECPQCGAKVKETGKFCNKCGHRF